MPCIHCGVVMKISSDKGKRMGYYTNILARLRITKVRIRQIVKELVRMDFDNVYSTTKSEQEEVFFRVVQKYSKVHEGKIRAFL